MGNQSLIDESPVDQSLNNKNSHPNRDGREFPRYHPDWPLEAAHSLTNGSFILRLASRVTLGLRA